MKRKILLAAVFAASGAAMANTAPVASGGDRPVHAGTSGSRTPWVNDADLWDTFTYQLSTVPLNGTAAFSGNRWIYTPNPGFTGVDSFTYSAADSGGASVTGTAKVRIYDDAALKVCNRNSTVNADGTLATRPKSNSCTFYGTTVTRTSSTGAATSIDYFVNWPSSDIKPKAVVVLIGGGDLTMGLAGNASTGVADSTGGGNFIVRIAQLLANAGYITVAMDRPSDLSPPGAFDPIPEVDRYRISVKHAVDILALVKRINTDNLDVYLAGTSRGAFSAVANNKIAAGIMVSSPVTSDPASGHLYVGQPSTPSLQASYVKRPIHLMWHDQDLCSISTPSGSRAFYNSLQTAGAAVDTTVAVGGVRVTTAGNNVTPDVCGAFDYHGFLGIEQTVAGNLVNWLNVRTGALAGNQRPEAAFVTSSGYAGQLTQFDLRSLARDADGDVLTYSLSHSVTALGGQVSINGGIVNYTAPAGTSGKRDYFVYVVTDGKGGVGAGVVEVVIN